MIIVDEITRPLPPAAATIGFFDGVHCGHRYLIGRVIDEARADGLASMVITFAHHILSSRLNVRKLIIGYDNRFGHDRSESIDDYCAYGRTLGIEVVKSCGITVDGIRVSSSVIRNAIERGDLTEANRCLGYAYTLSAHVSHGFRNGHRLGFPTANLDMDEVCQLLPQIGVYATRVRIEGECELHSAMTSVGTRPTFDGTRLSVETYILDFDADLYGRKIEVAFLKRIRGEKKFADLQQLRAQMADDERHIRELNHL